MANRPCFFGAKMRLKRKKLHAYFKYYILKRRFSQLIHRIKRAKRRKVGKDFHCSYFVELIKQQLQTK